MAHIPDNGADKPLSTSVMAIEINITRKKRKAVEDPVCHTAYLSDRIRDLERTLRPKTSNKVTFEVTDVQPNNYYSEDVTLENYFSNKEKLKGPTLRTPQEVLEPILDDTFGLNRNDMKEIIYSSIGDGPSNSGTSDVVPSSHGFVSTVLLAWNNHLHLEIRPDDVWISIITQFSRFINANAEHFRSKFVRFSAKENAFVTCRATRETLNYGLFAVEMSKLLEDTIVDPKLREWLSPQFSTTTVDDTIANSMAMMATLGHYFKYRSNALCGIPSVTLHGEKRDWEKLWKRIEKLKEFGLETTMWYHLLEPVLKRFVKAWDDPHGEWNKQFWGCAVTSSRLIKRGCAGPTYMDGWLTAFMPFTDEGKWQLKPSLPHVKQHLKASTSTTTEGSFTTFSRYEFMRNYNTSAMAYPIAVCEHSGPLFTRRVLSACYSEFGIDILGIKLPYDNDKRSSDYWERWATELAMPDGESVRQESKWVHHAKKMDGEAWSSTQLVIDGTWYPRGKKEELPSSICYADVLFEEDGQTFQSVMVGGVIGYHVRQKAVCKATHLGSDEQPSQETASLAESSVQPKVGWWIYEKKQRPDMEELEPELSLTYCSELESNLREMYGSDFEATMRQMYFFDQYFTQSNGDLS